MLEWILEALAHAGFSQRDVVFISGYAEDVVRERYPGLTLIRNEGWESNNILLSLQPAALSLNGAPVDSLPASSTLYFSFVNLTSTGMSDVLPAHPIARMLCVFEMITGVLFIAVLIARLVGSYPPPPR